MKGVFDCLCEILTALKYRPLFESHNDFIRAIERLFCHNERQFEDRISFDSNKSLFRVSITD